MTITYDDVKQFVDAGATTAAEVLTAMQADIRHKGNCWITGGPNQRTRLKHLLANVWNVVDKTEGNSFGGPLPQWSRDNPGTPAQTAIRKLLAQWDDPATQLFCSEDLGSAGMLELLIPVVGQLATDYDEAAVRATVYEITGGPRWAGVTEADIQAVLDTKAAQDAQAALKAIKDTAYDSLNTERDAARATAKAAYDAAIKPANDKYSAAYAWISSFDDTDPVALQSRVDAVVNSADGQGNEVGSPPEPQP